ncbi:hypothetical protein D3C72_1596100 [compost metagenome]
MPLENSFATPSRLVSMALSSLSLSIASVPSFWNEMPMDVSTFRSFGPPTCGATSAWRMRVCRLRRVESPTSGAAALASVSKAVSDFAVLCSAL